LISQLLYHYLEDNIWTVSVIGKLETHANSLSVNAIPL